MQVRAEQLAQHLAKGLKPLYTVWGDEPLLAQEAGDAIRVAARAAGCTERQVHTVSGAHFDWSSLLGASQAMSLFAERQLIEIRIPGGKPGKDGSEALQRYVEHLSDDVLTLVQCPRLDGQQTKSAWFSALDAAGEIAAFTDAQAELVAIAEDRGMWMRAMVDRFDEKNLVIWDYKTTSASAAPEAVGRLIESMGYDVSAAHYQHVFGLLRQEWRGRMTFRWLIQEAEPPYEATICTLDATGREIGARKAAFARGLWRDCMTSGVWPGYPRGLVTAAYPPWAETRWLERETAAYDAGRDPLRHEARPAPSRASNLLPPC